MAFAKYLRHTAMVFFTVFASCAPKSVTQVISEQYKTDTISPLLGASFRDGNQNVQFIPGAITQYVLQNDGVYKIWDVGQTYYCNPRKKFSSSFVKTLPPHRETYKKGLSFGTSDKNIFRYVNYVDFEFKDVKLYEVDEKEKQVLLANLLRRCAGLKARQKSIGQVTRLISGSISYTIELEKSLDLASRKEVRKILLGPQANWTDARKSTITGRSLFFGVSIEPVD